MKQTKEKSLKREITALQRQLNELVCQKSTISAEALKLSQKLDLKILGYYQLKLGK